MLCMCVECFWLVSPVPNITTNNNLNQLHSIVVVVSDSSAYNPLYTAYYMSIYAIRSLITTYTYKFTCECTTNELAHMHFNHLYVRV